MDSTNIHDAQADPSSAGGRGGTPSAGPLTTGHSDQGGTRRGDGRGRRRRRVERAAIEEGSGAGNVEGGGGPTRNTGAPRGRGGGQRGRGRGGQQKAPRPMRMDPNAQAQSTIEANGAGRSSPAPSGSGSISGAGEAQGAPSGPRRRRMMNSQLTVPNGAGPGNKNDDGEGGKQEQRRRESVPPQGTTPRADTLAGRLAKALRTHPYPDCPICFAAIHPAQPIWSCAPGLGSVKTVDGARSHDEDAAMNTQCCWTPFHMKCIRSWATKSVNDIREAYRARGEPERQGEWRCPGCQRKRLQVPTVYLCFCGSTPDPRPARLATPHSCGNSCARPRACGHACPLACHPGPCPPCAVTTQLPCYCPRRAIKSFRCAELAIGGSGADTANLSCGAVCGKMLSCGLHRCEQVCHPGDCDKCTVLEVARCYCGKEERTLGCGEGEVKHCAMASDGLLEEWDGRFACEQPCSRLFECGIHKCEKSCHPPSTDAPRCPRSPALVTHCPCGKKLLSEIEGGTRTTCSDPISTCGSTCMKPLEGCQHACSIPCHTGPCPPCSIPVVVPCRCGSTTRAIPCFESKSRASNEPLEILCDKPCSVLRACGRHQCGRVCCPLAALGAATNTKGKNKRRVLADDLVALGEEAHWHECDLTCGKLLGCGNHRCEARDHRGACRPCLRSSFEELICNCGQTIIEPPVPCGTRINCSYPCARPDPLCGHPKSTHSCHEDPTPCPPCPFLTAKFCACGKTMVNNVRCSQEKVSCGTTCGKLLDCGFHHCDRACHGGECGTCTLVCGKSRKLCLPAHHPCTDPCHAPAACSEDVPCEATITLYCQCGRIQQAARCARCISNPAGREGALGTAPLKCTNECAIAKRNARLAEALGISSEVQARAGAGPDVVYSDDLTAFARANAKFCVQVEKTFADFIASERKSQVLPYMHEARRKFVHDLAAVYRMDTQLVDEEPKRSIQLIRRIDTRLPKPVLSSTIASSNSLGKLADLRAPTTGAAAQLRPYAASPTPKLQAPAGSRPVARGWTSVVTRTPPRAASPARTNVGSSWRAPQEQSTEVREDGLGRPTANSANDASRLHTQLAQLTLAPAPGPGDGGVGIGASVPAEEVPESWENDV